MRLIKLSISDSHNYAISFTRQPVYLFFFFNIYIYVFFIDDEGRPSAIFSQERSLYDFVYVCIYVRMSVCMSVRVYFFICLFLYAITFHKFYRTNIVRRIPTLNKKDHSIFISFLIFLNLKTLESSANESSYHLSVHRRIYERRMQFEHRHYSPYFVLTINGFHQSIE